MSHKTLVFFNGLLCLKKYKTDRSLFYACKIYVRRSVAIRVLSAMFYSCRILYDFIVNLVPTTSIIIVADFVNFQSFKVCKCTLIRHEVCNLAGSSRSNIMLVKTALQEN